MTATAPEVHEGLPFDAYLDIDAVSATGLKDILVSPLLYAWRQEHGRPDKDALRVGRATHTAILEPHRFETDYVTWEGGRRSGKEWDAFCAANADRTILTLAQLATSQLVASAVHRHPVAAALLAQPGKAEVAITWQHGRTGLTCKSRIDWLCSALVDVKTCRDPSPHMFGTASARLGYHVQMAFYSAALASVGLELPVNIIAAQNTDPFDVVVYDVPADILLIGEQLYESAIDKLEACRRAGAWPGIAPAGVLMLTLPVWAKPDYDEGGGDWEVSVAEGV